MPMNYHVPIMQQECLNGLNIKPDGIYVDVTFGGGGHSKAILEQLGQQGKLFAFDQDADAKAQAKEIEDPRFTFIEANFRYIKKYLKLYKIEQVDGILADLGISSHQIDDASRGFSTRFDGPLDMRMSQKGSVSAQNIVNEYSEEQLHKILGMYGEVQNARTLAKTIFTHRQNQPIESTQNLRTLVLKHAPRGKENKYLAQVFQGIRIEVNEELKVLEEFLAQVPDLLSNTGRLAVMSFHSLEDRLVKNFIRTGKFFGEVEKDFYGNELRPLQGITRKPIEASAEEMAQNSRSRSAKLRVAGRFQHS